jgi:hypothetical protein
VKRPAALVAALLVALVPVSALADSHGKGRGPGPAVRGLKAALTDTAVHLTWSRPKAPVTVVRDGRVIARLAAGASSYDDRSATPQATHTYQVGASRVTVRTPDYLVGAATADLTPTGVVNLGGNGLGDGSLFPDAVIGRGGQGEAKNERIKVRATVIDDGRNAVAVASLEMQGWFAAYEDGPTGLRDMATEIARRVPRLPVSHIVLASDHSHSAPDTLGAWGGPKPGYMEFVKRQVVAAVTQAYASRVYANVVAGHSDASDLIYNQSCSEALNQDKDPAYPGPDVCATPGKDGMVRVLQATSPSGRHPLTFMAFAAHATAGGGQGIHGDWPQFLSEELSRRYGGTGLAMVGALGGTQPCRPACAFTKPTNPGYKVADRKTAIVLNYSAHVVDALAHTRRVTGPVAAAQGFIREPIVGPAVTALFTAGKYAGAGLLRNHEPPWVNAQTIRTVVGALRVGNVVIAATPGEAFPRIRQDIADAVGSQALEVISLGLANDQLGYLIAPVSYVPVIAAEVPVNDNIIFNVSPTIGDHVACADIRMVGMLGLRVSSPPTCAPYDVEDGLGDPLAAVPVGGVVLP